MRAAAALDADVEQLSPMPLAARLHCGPGELLALVGPSGAGKTSLVRILAGLVRPQRGRIAVGDEVWCDTARGIYLSPQRRHVGLVFQSYALMPHLDAIANVSLPLLHLPPGARQVQARRWLDHVGLTQEEQKRRPAALSGGQQQRVAVARALAREPTLMLLDEPFSAVDQMSRRGLYHLLAELRRELFIPIVLVTHDLNEARALADSLVVMDAGNVLQQGTPASVHNAPRNARVADLVGIHNRFRGEWMGLADAPGFGLLRWTDDSADSSHGPVLKVRDKGRLSFGQAVHWVIPSDGIALLDSQAPSQPGDLTAQVVEARHLGEITLVSLMLQELPGIRLLLTMSGAQRQTLSVGTSVHVRLDLNLVHVMPSRSK